MPKLAVLASGNGTNLQAILDESKSGKIIAVVDLVLSDRNGAFALERAQRAGVHTLCVDPKKHSSREKYDRELIQILRERNVDWIILAGFMRILSPPFVKAFQKRIVNIHPSLLPKYPGIQSVEKAFKAGEKKIGVTVHYVDEGVDTGPIILQDSIDVRDGETLEQVMERVHELEHRLYPEAIRRVLKEGNH